MSAILNALNILKRIEPTYNEISRIKILMAAHDRWLHPKQIRTRAGIPTSSRTKLSMLAIEGLLDIEEMPYKWQKGKITKAMHYKTSAKGMEYLTQLMNERKT
jgi:hypothetical protein